MNVASGTVAPAAAAAVSMRSGGPGMISGNSTTIVGTQVRFGTLPFSR